MKNEIDRILRFPEALSFSGYARSTIHLLVSQGKFPKPIKLSPNGRASGFLLSELQAWQQSRLAERDNIGA